MGGLGKPLISIAAAAGLALAKGVLSKPGMNAYMEYQIKRIFHGWSEDGNCPEEVSLTADAILSLFRSRGLSPNRIAVDGIPGSGKSTLAAALARKLDMTVECLDHKNMDRAISFAKDRTIYEHHRLLRTQGLDGFDALIYIDEPVDTSRQKVLQRKRGGYLVDIMNYDRLKAVGHKAFSVAAGDRPIEIPPSSFAPLATHKGKPVVAPVIKIALWRTISRPSSTAFPMALALQCAVSAAPETAILYFM